MKTKILLFSTVLFSLNVFGQEQIFVSRLGSKFFPGHLHVVLTFEQDYLRYELFNHWYTGAYAKLRDLEIPLSEIQKNDSLNFKMVKNGVYINDEKLHIHKRFKNKRLCASLENMRKISYACEVEQKNKIKHFDLYKDSDLILSEDEFIHKINANLKNKINEK